MAPVPVNEANRPDTFLAAADRIDASLDSDLSSLADGARLVRHFAQSGFHKAHRHLTELAYYTLHVSVETEAFLMTAFRQPHRREVWEKYLALVLVEAVETVPKLSNRLSGALHRNQQAADAGEPFVSLPFRVKAFREMDSAYRQVATSVRQDEDYEAIKRVRNSVAAHHLGRGGDMAPLVTWTLVMHGQQVSEPPTPTGPIIRLSERVAKAANAYGHGLVALVIRAGTGPPDSRGRG